MHALGEVHVLAAGDDGEAVATRVKTGHGKEFGFGFYGDAGGNFVEAGLQQMNVRTIGLKDR
jgi:hypothetical protein